MSIRDKDIKLLWSKVAGRCSICRKELSVEAESPSKNTLIGENCHIIGEKIEAGPRHKSNLSEDDRNRYPNLILLCRNHHIEIDSDETKYTVETLHQIKADHEVWVQTALTLNTESTSKKLYSDIINYITENLRLDIWDIISEHATRTIMYDSIVVGMSNTIVRLSRVSWPKDDKELEKEFKIFNENLEKYIKHYTSFCFRRSESSWIENKKKYYNPQTGFPTTDGITMEKYDYEIHFNNLWNLTVSINNLARIVRKNINEEYFLLQGDFVIYDDLGVTNNGHACVYYPNDYKAIVVSIP